MHVVTVVNATNVAVSLSTSVVQLVLSSVTSVVKVSMSVVVTSAVLVMVRVVSTNSVTEIVSKMGMPFAVCNWGMMTLSV